MEQPKYIQTQVNQENPHTTRENTPSIYNKSVEIPPEEEPTHTERIKKKYEHLERTIKWVLTQIFLLSNIWEENNICRWLSFTSKFKIRELEANENPKFNSNPSTIKRDTISESIEKVKKTLLQEIDNEVEDKKIAEKYKDGIWEFFREIRAKHIGFLKKHWGDKFIKYLKQTKEKNIGIQRRNITQQIAKILCSKFWENAFSIQENWVEVSLKWEVDKSKKNEEQTVTVIVKKDWKEKTKITVIVTINEAGDRMKLRKKEEAKEIVEDPYKNVKVKDGEIAVPTEEIKGEDLIDWLPQEVILSQKSIDYIFTLFYNANKVWESWWKNTDQVFHDWDCSFITDNIKANEWNYIQTLIYLINKQKKNYYWRRWRSWKKQRTNKTSQYADILRALTNNQLMIDQIDFSNKNTPDFTRDETTQNLFKIWWWLLENEVDRYNSIKSKKSKFYRRLKSISSCVEKIIEGKKINDVIWLRVSTKWVNNSIYEDIKEISCNWLERFKASLWKYPWKYIPWYSTESWDTISIKEVTIDNKWVLNDEEMSQIIQYLNDKINGENWNIQFTKRKRPESPYIEQEERENRIKEYYPEIINDKRKWSAIREFYRKIRNWISRWKNWWYKDFKFNIIFEIKNKNKKTTSERTMEVQFDDINNGKWLSNFNIRNFERWVNTQSRLSFSVTLWEARKDCEKRLKKMWMRINELDLSEKEKKEFFTITFKDNPEISVDISDFMMRTNKNSIKMDITIVNIINYFIKKGSFVLCDNGNSKNNRKLNRLLTVQDLKDESLMENLHICSILELASQQHSYLQDERNREVWIYIESEKKIKRISLWELINPMNLWKKKDPQFYEEP